jgi:hypothetical protein
MPSLQRASEAPALWRISTRETKRVRDHLMGFWSMLNTRSILRPCGRRREQMSLCESEMALSP